jgi:hypothetical protein
MEAVPGSHPNISSRAIESTDTIFLQDRTLITGGNASHITYVSGVHLCREGVQSPLSELDRRPSQACGRPPDSHKKAETGHV